MAEAHDHHPRPKHPHTPVAIMLGRALWLLALVFLSACGGEFVESLLTEEGPYQTTFDEVENWGVGSEAAVEGAVQDGVYRMTVNADSGLFWATAGKTLGDGRYQIETTAVAGPENNGFGILFMMDTEENEFYLFQVSSDGFIWIGRCVAGCEADIIYLVGDGWFESAAVNQGLGALNTLVVEVVDGQMIFFVNGEQVGEAFDNDLRQGDIGVVVESIGVGGVEIHFDNFSFTPAESSP